VIVDEDKVDELVDEETADDVTSDNSDAVWLRVAHGIKHRRPVVTIPPR